MQKTEQPEPFNPHKRVHQFERRDKLVTYFDLWIRRAKFDPFTHAAEIADGLRRMTAVARKGHSQLAGLRGEASDETWELLVAVYDGRAKATAEAIEKAKAS